MVREDEKQLRLKQQRSKEAIDLAMQARWQEAVDVNKQIIETFPDDVDSYNRLGRAYMELGQYTKAREAYQNAVKIDPYNAIAGRNIRRLNDINEADHDEVETDKVEPQKFIEEIGKAGVVTLYDLAPKERRARVVAGDKVNLKVAGGGLVIEDIRSEYLGKVEPKYGPRLTRLILGGNQYAASVVKSSSDIMTVIIREIFQHPSQAGKLSFPPRGMEEVHPYGSDKLVKVDAEEEEETGYTIIGSDGVELIAEETEDSDDNESDEE